MSLQNIASPTPGQGGADRAARHDHLESTRPRGLATPRPYAAVPHDLIADPRLKPLDVRLVGVLLRYARVKEVCWPSVRTLATDLARCERTVQYALSRLTNAGWIATRPDSNPTGRLIVLTWREPRCTPPVQAAYSQGLPRMHPVAPEPKNENQREGVASARTKSKAPEPPMTHGELMAQYAATGWLERPLSDPLRQIAERSLAKALGMAWGEPETSPAAGLTIAARSWRKR